MVALISARLTNKLMTITSTGQVNEISQMCRGKEARNSYGIFDEFRLTRNTSWL